MIVEAATRRKSCFVISPIGDPDTDVRKKSDQVLRFLIKSALEPEYEVERADQIGRPGIITAQIVERVVNAELLVADLTDRNPNVFYELAIRHAAQKPAIHIVSRGQQDVPFDVQDMRFVPYDLTDPEILEEARENLRSAAKAIKEGGPSITPVQMGLILLSLSPTGSRDRDSQFKILFDSLNAGMSNLQEGIAEIVQDLRIRRQPAFLSGQVPFTGLTSFASPASGFNFPIQANFTQAIAELQRQQLAEHAAKVAAKQAEKAKETKESKEEK